MALELLSQMNVDVFIQSITYLPFQDVVSVCSANKTLHSYCNDPRYNKKWKRLIDNTFGKVYDYQNKLQQIWNKLGYKQPTYNYLVYTQLVKLLDPVTQAMIYYRQGDMDSFKEVSKVLASPIKIKGRLLSFVITSNFGLSRPADPTSAPLRNIISVFVNGVTTRRNLMLLFDIYRKYNQVPINSEQLMATGIVNPDQLIPGVVAYLNNPRVATRLDQEYRLYKSLLE